jgi:hypothetical protein
MWLYGDWLDGRVPLSIRYLGGLFPRG